MRRSFGPIISSAIALAVAMVVFLDFVLDTPMLNSVGAVLVDYGLIVGAFALILGVANVLVVHLRRARLRQPGWISSLILIGVVVFLLVVGILGGEGPNQAMVAFAFEYMLVPLQAAAFSLIAFWMLFLAYRALRVRGTESFFFLVAALVVMVGAMPLTVLGDGIPAFRDFFLRVPVMAGARGILIGITLGVLATGMRLLFDGRRYFK